MKLRTISVKRLILQIAGWAAISAGLLVALLVAAPVASANSLHPVSAASMPNVPAFYLAACSNGPAYITWISAAGDPTNTSPTVAYGAKSIQLQFNDAGAVCESSDSFVAAHSHITVASASTPTGVVDGLPGLNGTERQLTFSPNQHDPGFDDLKSTVFTYTPTGGFTTQGTYNITANSWFVAWRQDNTFWCVPDGNQSFDWANDGGACTTRPDTSPIQINVQAGNAIGQRIEPNGNPLNGTNGQVSFDGGGTFGCTISGCTQTGNSFWFTGTVASHTLSAQQTITYNGQTYSLVGYYSCLQCANNDPKANGTYTALNGGNSATISLVWFGSNLNTSVWWVYQVAGQALTCSPVSQSTQTGTVVNFTAANGTIYSWSAPGSNTTSGSGSTFSTNYPLTGSFNVTVTSGGSSASCAVNVLPTGTPPPPPSKPTFTQDFLGDKPPFF